MEHISVDLWASNLEVPTPSLAAWLLAVENRLAAAANSGAQMLVLPEFACAQWLTFAPADLPPTSILGWLSEIGVEAIAAMSALATRYQTTLLPGTIPHYAGDREGVPTYTNRAWLLTPDGQAHCQDKLSLTPIEADGECGITLPGSEITVIPWNGLRVVMAVCLDAEFTALWTRLSKLDVDLVLIPAKTEMITGYNRVFSCARSRAIELQTVVCAVGAVGEPLGHPSTDPGVGGASVFLPCDVSVDLDGVFAALAPQPASALTNPVLAARQIPVGAVRRIRNGASEAERNPASWEAEDLLVRG